MNNSDAIIDCLTSNEIDTIFGIPGKQTLPLNKSVSERDEIRFVMARHETNVSHQAWGYAETSGKMAATVVIPGPGDMNAMNGLKNAYNDCTPLLHIAVETDPDIRDGDGIHETPPDTYDNVVKENVTVESPESTVVEVERAIEIAQTPPKGPVRVGIPKSFIPVNIEVAGREKRAIAQPSLPERKIQTASERLADVAEPVIIAGGGVRAAEASDELRKVAEILQAPVATTYKGKGTFPEDHPLSTSVFCGGTSKELKELIEDADAVLGVGTDFDAVWTKRWSYELPDELIHITLDGSDIGRGYDPSVGIVADAKAALAAIAKELKPLNIQSENGETRATNVREGENSRFSELESATGPRLTSVSVLKALREALPRETIVAADAGGSRIWTLLSFPVYDPRNYVNPGSWASMGVGIGSAIGAKTANPEQPVVSFIGEGGLMMCLEELHTLVAESLDVTVFVFNNNDYAIISEEANRSYDLNQSEYGWTESPIDFSKIADGMGLRTKRAETPKEIIEVTQETLNTGPTLVEIPTDPHEPQAGEFMVR